MVFSACRLPALPQRLGWRRALRGNDEQLRERNAKRGCQAIEDVDRLFRQPVPSVIVEDQPQFTMSAAGAFATAYETDDGFVVRSGSTARMGGSKTFPAAYRALRDQLVQTGRLVEATSAGFYEFVEDSVFSSTSAAAAVVAARSASGPLEWKVADTGRSYRDWRGEQLGAG